MADPNIDGRSLRKLLLGLKVDRATAALPQSTTGHLFTIAGGRVMVPLILGEVTTAIQAQATTAKLTSTPTTGTAVDVCGTLDLTGKEIGTLLTVTGTFANALVGANAGAASMQDRPFVLPIGFLDLITVASSTGSIKWTVFYIPIDDGASVVAA